MKVGTKSLLFGVHQFILHPLVVLRAWIYLYGLPNLKELVCIIIHDWGYLGLPNMDGNEGTKHPEFAAKLAGKWFGQEYYDLCICHSRHYAKVIGKEPSKLCWADKLCIKYNPWWFYVPISILTGEIFEYRKVSADMGLIPLSISHKEWFQLVKGKMVKQIMEQNKINKSERRKRNT